jgi:two-component system, OmpR family, osmolarity sensor histidine kinase EnvZ
MATQLMTRLKHRFLPRTLFGRSLLIIATPILLLQLIVSFIFFDRHWDSMSSRLVYALAGEISMLTSQISEAETEQDIQDLIGESSKSLDIYIQIDPLDADTMSADVKAFQQFYWFSIGGKLKEALGRRIAHPFVFRSSENEKRFSVIVQLDDQRMVTFICAERRLMSVTTYIFILWLIGSAVVLFGIAIIFMRNQIRPIRRLAIAAEKLGKGHDVPDFKPVGASEVRQASQAFLDMKDRLKRQIEQRTAMLSGVSHDLRTPLTRMKLQIAMSPNNPEVENLRQDIDEMERMLEGYLTFAKGEGSEALEMTDLRAVLNRILGRARRENRNIKEKLADHLMIRLRPMAMERAIANIVSNACKYADNVWVSAYEESDMVAIVVDDDGPGIAEELREDVFRPFYRVEKSRNQKTGGVGLGLAIARDIIHARGGEIFLESSNRGGLRVVIRLPV